MGRRLDEPAANFLPSCQAALRLVFDRCAQPPPMARPRAVQRGPRRPPSRPRHSWTSRRCCSGASRELPHGTGSSFGVPRGDGAGWLVPKMPDPSPHMSSIQSSGPISTTSTLTTSCITRTICSNALAAGVTRSTSSRDFSVRRRTSLSHRLKRLLMCLNANMDGFLRSLETASTMTPS